MPPKIVYGKKRPVAQQQPSFTKFLSPEKDVVRGEKQRIAASVVTSSWRQQLEDAACIEEKDEVAEDEVAALEKGLESLQIEQMQAQGVTEKARPRKSADVPKAGKTKANATSIEDALELDMGALTIGAAQEEVVVRRKPGRPRKALENRDANAVNEERCSTKPTKRKQKQENVENTEGQTESAPHTRIRKPVGKAKSGSAATQQKPQLPTPEPSPEPEDIYSLYTSPLSSLSDRKTIVPFEHWSAELEPHFEITKIAEASFSEVYRLSASSELNGIREESVLKVVALKTPPEAPLPCQIQSRPIRDFDGQLAKEMAEREENDVWKSQVADVLSEVKLLQNLNHIPGFTVFRDLTIVQGRPSAPFSKAWTNWNKSRPRGKKSEFPDPSKKTSYDDTQLWAIVEMQDAGTDCEKIMENGGLTSIWEVWDVFWGVCLSVAKAEEACQFEHRDLHLGNICVRSSRPGGDVMQSGVQDPLRRKLRFTGLDTTVIDYTLSRADIVAAPSRRSSSSTSTLSVSSTSGLNLSETNVAYLDLNKDPALFEGDPSEEYQYEIYRYMRGAALYNNPLQSAPAPSPVVETPSTPRRSPRKNTHIRFDEDELPRRSPRKHGKVEIIEVAEKKESEDGDIWRKFHPKTNLVWAHFLLHKLLNHMQYHNSTPDQLSLKDLMRNTVPNEEPVEDVKVKRKAVKLYKVLQRVSELLCPVALGREEGLSSVKELVVLALEERWIRVGDVAG